MDDTKLVLPNFEDIISIFSKVFVSYGTQELLYTEVQAGNESAHCHCKKYGERLGGVRSVKIDYGQSNIDRLGLWGVNIWVSCC